MTSAKQNLSVRDGSEVARSINHVLVDDVSRLTDAELLAVLLRHTYRSCDVVEEAGRLLREAGSLRRLICEPSAGATSGPGSRRHSILQAALELTRRHYRQELSAGPALESPAATRAFLIAQLRDKPYEVFCVLFLDNRHRLIAFDELFRGTIDGASVHPREVVRQALHRNAAAVILAHNHPSGVAEPSQADELITLRLRDALGLVDIRVLDHLIVGDTRCVSLAERGAI
jgi:DNA repair protein RadC